MAYRGKIKGGVVVLDNPAALPEGTVVYGEPAEPQPPRTLLDRFRDVVGAVPDLPEDMADNHDHYLYGTEKKAVFCRSPSESA